MKGKLNKLEPTRGRGTIRKQLEKHLIWCPRDADLKYVRRTQTVSKLGRDQRTLQTTGRTFKATSSRRQKHECEGLN